MEKSQLQIESLILVALAKNFNSQGTYLIGELKAQTKFNFNVAMSATNNFVKSIEDKLGDNLQKFDDFFSKENGYNSKILEENGLDESLLSDYADYGLGLKILKCVEEQGYCQFTAEC